MVCYVLIDKLKIYLEETYKKFGKDVDLDNFYSPIGLDLGGGTPEDIAISIAAEILSIHFGKKKAKNIWGRLSMITIVTGKINDGKTTELKLLYHKDKKRGGWLYIC